LPEKTPEKQPEKQPEKTPEAPPPVMVEITISDAPDGTQVYGPGGVLLATLPGKLEVRRSDEPLQITLKHDGFDTRVEKIAVASATKIALPLQKTKVPKPPVGPGSQKPPVGPGSQKPPKPPKPPGGPGSSDIPEF
jgi:hypothetical protein